MKGVKFTPKQKEEALKLWMVEGVHWMKVCSKYKCTRVSLWRWKKQYDNTLESLKNKSSRPKTPHPTAQTEYEKSCILQVYNENPELTRLEMWVILRDKYNYPRHFMTMCKYISKHILKKNDTDIKYVPQPYETPDMLAEKWQIDVKFVPQKCYIGGNKDKKFYQYTALDEATRERFMFQYDHHDSAATKDFIQKAIKFFGYKPKIIQTDNGGEFVNNLVNKYFKRQNIKHQRIKPRTPRHNGKVERAHRTDQECFYNYLKFSTLDELREKMSIWVMRYNKKPISTLRNQYGKVVFFSPLEKRAELIQILIDKCEETKANQFNKKRVA